MKKNKLFLANILVIIILLSGCSADISSGDSGIDSGILDLTAWDFDSGNNIKLDGEWEFYWSKLLTYEEIKNEKPDLYAEVPNAWNTYTLNGAALPGAGYATYRLHVRTSLPKGTLMGLRSYAFSSAYKLFINDKLIASNGRVAVTAEEESGEYRPQAVIFEIPAEEFDIIIQVSNFHYARGGFWYSMYLGSDRNILNLNDIIMGKEIFLIGALLIIALFYFAVFILRKELRYTLYFSLFCFTAAIAIDMVGQYLIPRAIPGMDLSTVILIWYSSGVWIMFLLILYVHELFTSRISTIIKNIFLGYAVIFQVLYILTNPVFYSRTGYVCNMIEIVGYLCTVVITAIGMRNGNKSGWMNVISMVIAFAAYTHDILYWTNLIRNDFGEVFYLGLFLFIFIQMVIQAQRIKLFHDNEIAAELSFLQAQIKPHFLYNTLNTFVSMSYFDMDKARSLLTDLSHYLRRSFDFKDLSQFVPLKNEIELAKAYVEIEKARFEERLEVVFDVPEDLEVNVPRLMLQPLIENAIIHGILPKPEGGKIDILVKQEAKQLVFQVKDNGIGMDTKKLLNTLRQEKRNSVGIANIDSRLKKLYGKGLEFKSSLGAGTEVAWNIPLNGRRN
ncbi:MAG TPA: histidine kinase [Bacillota bacterium]|nr:histidine kinase [Bacillota bacterium]